MLARFGREHAKALKLARRANGVYRRQLRGRCLASFATPKSDLHLINRLQYRFARLARAYIRRDGLGIFIEHLILDQVLAGVEDGGGAQARRDWRAFRSACRPVAVSAPSAPAEI